MRSEGRPARGRVVVLLVAVAVAVASCHGDEEDARCVLSRSCGGGPDSTGGGPDSTGGALECEPGETTSCPSDCPSLAGYSVSCNGASHCEYTPGTPIVSGGQERLIFVPPSAFPMGSPAGEGSSDERPQHCVSFAAGYFVGKHEVTAEAFAAFLTSRGSNECSHGGGSANCLDASDVDRNVDWDGTALEADSRRTCEASAGGAADASCGSHPVVEVTWYGAGAFCAWVGGRLCTESEWERAAKGTSHREYPWGDAAPDETLANCSESSCGDGFDGTSSVGSFAAGASPVGAQDMAGNVWEWVEDDWHGSYDGAPDDGSAWNDSPRAAARVRRGGGWGSAADALRASYRSYDVPAGSDYAIGLRCCRSVY